MPIKSKASGLDTTFDTGQYALPYALGVEHHFWNVARNRIVERHVRKTLARQLNPQAIILDVGCGPGIVVDHLRHAGIDCHGVELGRPVVRAGLEQIVQTGTDARDLPADLRSRTGTILLLDVVEHIEQPDEFIHGLRSAFPAVEHFIVTVPARMELWSNYDKFYGHFLRYDKPSLTALAERTELDVVVMKYFFAGLYPAMKLTLHRNNERPIETKPPLGAGLWAHAAIGRAFALEERLPILGAVPGTSLLCILSARRPSSS